MATHNIFPAYKGLVKVSKLRQKIGQQRYTISAKITEDFTFETIIAAYNREDAIFRATSYFPNGRFIRVNNK